MGFFSNLKTALDSKRKDLGKVNTFLTNTDWAQTQRKLDELEKEANDVFVYNPEVLAHQETCKAEVDDYKAEVVNIKADCVKEIGDAVSMVNYTKVNSAGDFKDLSNKAVDKATEAVGKARVDMEKAGGNALKKIFDKLKSIGTKKTGIDLRSVYERVEETQENEKKKSEFSRMEQNFALSREAAIQKANRAGFVKEHNKIISDLSETHKNIKIINESQEINEYLKKIPLEKLAEINKRLTDVVPHALMLESDANGRGLTVTKEQIELQGEKVKKLADEVNEKMNAASTALNIQRYAMQEFDKVCLDPALRETYSLVDMQMLGLRAREIVERKNSIVMFSKAMNEPGGHPAVFVVDHDGSVHAYDTFAMCDAVRNIGLTSPDKLNALTVEGGLQNNANFSLDGRVEAYVNYVRDFINTKDREQQLIADSVKAANARGALTINYDQMELTRMKNEREMQEATSPYLYKENFDYLNAPSKMQETLSPLLINISKDMEAREQHDAIMTGSTLLARDSLKEGPNGAEYEQVLVLSVSIDGKNKENQPTHPTMNIVCNENGEFQAAYFSEELHYATSSYLGNKIADTVNGIDYSYYSNNPIVRNFVESFPSLKEDIESHCDASKFYDTRNITLEDIKKTQEAVEQDEYGRY